jgi:CheY-like chemotaxis protein
LAGFVREEDEPGMAIAIHAGLRTADGRPPRVAVVDGNRTSAMVLTVLVEAFGCWPLPAANAEATLALVRREGLIDLVMIDLGLTDMDGMVAVQLIHALRHDFPILGLAGKRSDLARLRTRAARLSTVLVKPFTPNELYDAIAAALGKARAIAMFN